MRLRAEAGERADRAERSVAQEQRRLAPRSSAMPRRWGAAGVLLSLSQLGLSQLFILGCAPMMLAMDATISCSSVRRPGRPIAVEFPG